MLDQDLNNLPILNSFEGLKRGDKVYSKSYGIGEMLSFHNDEIIVQFPDLRKRFSVEEQAISKIPDKYLVKPKNKVVVRCEGKSISFAEFKKRMKIERQREKMKEVFKSLPNDLGRFL